MSIVRKAKRRENFTTISNEVPHNEQLSYRAVGLWTYLMTKPDHWQAKVTHLAGQHSEGRDAVRAALIELERAGYVVRRWIRDGTKTPTREYVVFETLDEARAERGEDGSDDLTAPQLGMTGNPSSPESGSTGNPHAGKPAASKYSVQANTDLPPHPPKTERVVSSPADDDEDEFEGDVDALIAYLRDPDRPSTVDDGDYPAVDAATVHDLARHVLARQQADPTGPPVQFPVRWLKTARSNLRKDEMLPKAVAAIRHPALGCDRHGADPDELRLNTLAHVHHAGEWPSVPPPRRHVEIDLEVSTNVDIASERTPMPASVRDALPGAHR